MFNFTTIFYSAYALGLLITIGMGILNNSNSGDDVAIITSIREQFSCLKFIKSDFSKDADKLKEAYMLLAKKSAASADMYYTCNPNYPCIPHDLLKGQWGKPDGYFANSYMGRVEEAWVSDLHNRVRYIAHGFLVKFIDSQTFDPSSLHLTEKQQLFLNWYCSWKDDPQFQIFKQFYVHPLDPGFDTMPTRIRIVEFDYGDIEMGLRQKYVERRYNHQDFRWVTTIFERHEIADLTLDSQPRFLPFKGEDKPFFTTYEAGYTRGLYSERTAIEARINREHAYNQNISSVYFFDRPNKRSLLDVALADFFRAHDHLFPGDEAVEYFILNKGDRNPDPIGNPCVVMLTPADTLIATISRIISEETKIPLDKVITTLASTLVHNESSFFAYYADHMQTMEKAVEQAKIKAILPHLNKRHTIEWVA